MTVSSEILTPALRDCGAVPAAREPTGPEAADALLKYNLMMSGLRGEIIGQPVVSKQITASRTANVGVMYVYGGATQITLTLPVTARAGARIGASAVGAGNVSISPGVFLVQGQSSTSVASGERVWFFDGRGDWVRETDAELTDAVVFAPEYRQALVDILTVRLALEYGLPATEAQTALAMAGAAKLKKHYNGAG